MTEEMKLLTALIDVLGFDVITDLDYQERKETLNSAMRYNDGRVDHNRSLASKGPFSELEIDKDGMYTSVLKQPEISYRVVPKINVEQTPQTSQG